MITGLLSNAAWDPRLMANAMGQDRALGPFDVYLFTWPTHPAWLYAASQGIHVTVGFALIPVVLVKQWSVLPRLFSWPPVGSPAHALERLSLVFLVGGIYFEFVTGILFTEYWFGPGTPDAFNFDSAHYYGAWVFFGAFLLHVLVKLPRMRKALATRNAITISDLAHTRPEPSDGAHESLVPVAPASPSMTRRALLGGVAAGSILLGAEAIAQDVGGPVRSLALMFPRGTTLGGGPNDFPVNGTVALAGLTPEDLASWRLLIRGDTGQSHVFARDQLLAMPQHAYSLVLACREGWSTRQLWSGVRLRDLAAAVGMTGLVTVDMSALDGASASLAANQVSAESALLALGVNGAPLSPDHGFPARVIIPADIAVNCLKWVNQLTFHATNRA
jgi:DMSO/TMAO reductase YedYZ molybdopterin-dependent catalytic subunit